VGGRGLPALPSRARLEGRGEKGRGEGRGGKRRKTGWGGLKRKGKTTRAVPTALREPASTASGDQLGPEGRVPEEERPKPNLEMPTPLSAPA
jgi:hypothetical protein